MTEYTIALDVDGVLANLVDAFLYKYNLASGDNLTADKITAWDVSQFVMPEYASSAFSFFGTPNIYNIVKPYPMAAEIVQKLRTLPTRFRLVFVTTPFKGTEGRKLKWLADNNMLYDSSDYMEVHDKSLVRAHVLLDDGLHNLFQFSKTGGVAWMMEQPWNNSSPYYPRVKTLYDFYNACKDGTVFQKKLRGF
jgi:5'(3')-deoxyribonucleotidase